MKILSLFDGISCGRIALERAGITIDKYVAYEIDENAIKISEHNYTDIIRKGDVFKADYNETYDLLIGGSPCTFWSVAQHSEKREITCKGFGFDLFLQYYRALIETKPKYFIYENNYGISPLIVTKISEILGVQPIMIDSSLVSAQQRKRLYWTNIPNVEQPKDKGILLPDVIDFTQHKFRPVGDWVYSYWNDKMKIDMLCTIDSKKSHTLTTSKTHPRNYYLDGSGYFYTNLTVNDWEILQTLPLNYVDSVDITQGAKYKAIGNGWTVDVIAHIMSYIPKCKQIVNKS